MPKPQWLFCQNTLVVRLGRRFVLDHPGCGQIADLACVAGPSTGVVLYAREPANWATPEARLQRDGG